MNKVLIDKRCGQMLPLSKVDIKYLQNKVKTLSTLIKQYRHESHKRFQQYPIDRLFKLQFYEWHCKERESWRKALTESTQFLIQVTQELDMANEIIEEKNK